jgi:hypothetical protein
MAIEADVRWFTVHKWEIRLWRAEAILWLTSLAVVPLAWLLGDRVAVGLLDDRVVAWFLALGCAFILRFLRSVTLAIAVLPGAILVRRALSLRDERIPIDGIRHAVHRRQWLGEEVALYQRNRLRSPAWLVSSLGIGYPRREWQELIAALTGALEPIGKWKRLPWWRPLFPL